MIRRANNGGSRATTAISDRHAARQVLQKASVLIADLVRVASAIPGAC